MDEQNSEQMSFYYPMYRQPPEMQIHEEIQQDYSKSINPQLQRMYHPDSQNQNEYSMPKEEPICKRLPKRKCVLELEKMKSSLVEPEMVIYEPPKKTLARTGCFGRRRGRPPSKPRACNYVFTTNFINFCSALITSGLTEMNIIELHKQFFKPYTPLSPETQANALMKLEQYKISLTSNPMQQPMIQNNRNVSNNNVQPYVQNNYNMNYGRFQNVPQPQYLNNYSTPVSQNFVDNRYPISYPQNYLLQMTSNMSSNMSSNIASNNTNSLQSQQGQTLQYPNMRASQPIVYNVNPVCQPTYLQEQTQRLAGRSLQEAYNTNPIYMKQYTGSSNR